MENNVAAQQGVARKKVLPLCRLRVRFSRGGAARGLSHLEQIKAVRELVMKSGLPYVRSGAGEHSVPKISFGPAISVGYGSLTEYADIYLAFPVSEKDAAEKLGLAFSSGFTVLEVKKIPLSFPSIESLVNIAEYEIGGEFNLPEDSVSRFLAQDAIPVVKTKPCGVQENIDARPLVASMKMSGGKLSLLLRFGPKKNLKPELIVAAWYEFSRAGTPPVLDILKRQLYWEQPSGKLVAP